MNICRYVRMFVPYTLLYHSSDSDKTLASCCMQAREGSHVVEPKNIDEVDPLNSTPKG